MGCVGDVRALAVGSPTEESAFVNTPVDGPVRLRVLGLAGDAGTDADVRPSVPENRSEMDRVVERELVVWLRDVWSFEDPRHTVRG